MIRALFLHFVLFCSLASGQQVSSVWYDTENGLPQNSVKDIVQDRYGFIWISTENGLVKYDGNLFRVINHLSNNNRFSYFGGDKSLDKIYTVTAYQEEVVKISKMSAKKASHAEYNIFTKNKNKIYYDYVKNGLHIELDKTNNYIQLQKKSYFLDDHSVTLKEENGSEKLIIDGLWNNYKNDIFCINNEIYIISKKQKKIIKIYGAEVSYINGNPLLYHLSSELFWSKVNNQTFIIHDNVLYKVYQNNGSLEIEKVIKYDFQENTIFSIFYQEKLKILFLGSATNGLNVVKINQFEVATRNDKYNVFYSLLPIDSNRVITTTGEVFSKRGLHDIYSQVKAKPYFLHKDSTQNIYIFTKKGLTKIYKNSDYKTQEILIPQNNITYFNQFDNLSTVAFTDQLARNNILAIYKDNNYKSPISKSYFKTIINVVRKINESELLIGTRTGLYKLDLRTNVYSEIKYKNDIEVRDIIITKDGNLWIMTYGDGFFLYRDKQLIKMPLDDMGRLASAHSIQEDKNGYLWISSNNGLFKINKKILLNYSKTFDGNIHYYRYTRDDGFLINEFNGGCTPSSVQLPNGDFVFPSMNGIVFFNPHEVKSYFPDTFYISTVKLFDSESSYKNQFLNLSNNFYKAEVYIDVPYFSDPENLIMEGKIENSKNPKWERISARKFVIMGLEPGDYVLKLRLLSSDNGEYIYKDINISVDYLFYQTILFKLILVIFIFIIVLVIIKLRIRKQQLKNMELERIIEVRTEKLTDTVKKLEYTKERLRRETKQQQKLLETISHDVITPAKYLAITTKKLFETEEENFHKIKQYFEVLYKSSEEFYNFIKTLKDYAEIYRNNNDESTEVFSLNEIVEAKILLFDEIAKANNTTIHTHFKREVHINSNKNVINIIIHNLIDNAVKNTNNGFIDVFVERTNESKIVIIKDSGNGMTNEQIKYYNEIQKNNLEDKLILQKYGLGLHLVLQLLIMIDGELQFAQNFPKGTTAIINIKNMSYE